MKSGQFQISIFHLLAIILSVILVIYVGISQNKITMETITSNTEAQHLQVVRRLFMSPDCLAYESREYGVVNNTDLFNVVSARKVYPLVVDINKLRNWENVNCLRNVVGSHVISGLPAPLQFRVYQIKVTNLETGEVIQTGTTFPQYYNSTTDTYENVVYPGSGLCTKYYYDTFPVLLFRDGVFYNGLVYIESCLKGEIISKEEISYGKV